MYLAREFRDQQLLYAVRTHGMFKTIAESKAAMEAKRITFYEVRETFTSQKRIVFDTFSTELRRA